MVLGGTSFLPLDIYETADDIVVRAVIPGVTPDRMKDRIPERGADAPRRSEEPLLPDGARWSVHEITAGEYVRQVTLSRSIDPDKATTTFENGVLTMTLPKTADSKPKQIRITAPSQVTAGSWAQLTTMLVDERDGVFTIAVASRLTGMHPQTLRKYERAGLLRPSRQSANQRLYSSADIERSTTSATSSRSGALTSRVSRSRSRSSTAWTWLVRVPPGRNSGPRSGTPWVSAAGLRTRYRPRERASPSLTRKRSSRTGSARHPRRSCQRTMSMDTTRVLALSLSLLVIPASVAAHTPSVADEQNTSPAAAVVLDDPTLSRAIGATIAAPGEIDWYRMDLRAGDPLVVGMTAPDAVGSLPATFLLLGPGLPDPAPAGQRAVGLAAMTGATGAIPFRPAAEPAHEMHAGLGFLDYGNVTLAAPAAGTYWIAVFAVDPAATGKYVLAPGVRRSSGWTQWKGWETWPRSSRLPGHGRDRSTGRECVAPGRNTGQ